MNTLMLFLVVVLIAINAFFVAAEYALVRSRRHRLEILKEQRARGAGLALKQLEKINEYISAIQIGITMTSIGIGAIGEPALAAILKNTFGTALSHGVSVAISVVVAFLIIATAQLIAGEMVPKFYAIGRAEAIARRVSRPLQAFSVLFHPFVIVLTAVSDGILHMLGADMSSEKHGGSPDELKLLIAESHEGGHIDIGEAGMLAGVFHLHEQEARQVMTPAPEIVTVDISMKVKGALEECTTSGHTRLVVIENNDPDKVRGTVHVKTLVRQLRQVGPHSSFASLVQEALIVPETKPLDDLLADLQKKKTSMAIVADEYGRVVGVVTVEDILEEIVGEIGDETDPAVDDIRRLKNGDWFVRGHVAINDLLDYDLELPADTDAYNSVGGFVFSGLGRLPKRGDVLKVDGFTIFVDSVRGNRIGSVRIQQHPAAPSPAESD